MAEADFNELLLLQDKDFDKETKAYAMELYYERIDAETATAILWEKGNNEWKNKMKAMETLENNMQMK